MVKPFKNEDEFQKWVIQRFRGLIPGAHVQDFSDRADDVPDINVATQDMDCFPCLSGTEYWLELKFDWFRLGHDKYDDFKWSKMQRGQLEWLRRRARSNTAVCGILGYARTYGTDKKSAIGCDYYVYHEVEQYFNEVWQKTGYSIGALALGPRSVSAHLIKTGRDLQRFIDTARCTPFGNAA